MYYPTDTTHLDSAAAPVASGIRGSLPPATAEEKRREEKRREEKDRSGTLVQTLVQTLGQNAGSKRIPLKGTRSHYNRANPATE